MKALTVCAVLLSTAGCNAIATGPTSAVLTSVGPNCLTVPPATTIRVGDHQYSFGPHRTILLDGHQTATGQDWANIIGTNHGVYIVQLGGAVWVSAVPDVWIRQGMASDVLSAEELHPAGCPVVSIGGL